MATWEEGAPLGYLVRLAVFVLSSLSKARVIRPCISPPPLDEDRVTRGGSGGCVDRSRECTACAGCPYRTTAVRKSRQIGRAGSLHPAAGWLASTDPEQACILPTLENLLYKNNEGNTESAAPESAAIERIAAIELHEVY